MTRHETIINREYMLMAVAATAVAAMAFVKPIPQDVGYHAFADTRTLFSIPNFWNVFSNVPFVIVGLAGLAYSAPGNRHSLLSLLRPAYIVFFAGVLLTGFGSAFYHLAPGNQTLIWDRLPMTLAFMGLFAIIIGEHVSPRRGRQLLLPLLIAGAASVAFWAITEARGSGDLRPYALVQFLPVILIPLILSTYKSQYDRTAFIWWVVAIYAASKVPEHFDQEIYSLTGVISGHFLKHVVASAAPLVLLHGFTTRRSVAAHRSAE